MSWSSTLRALVGHLHVRLGKQAAQEVVQLLGNAYTDDRLRLLAERGAAGDTCLRYFDATARSA